MKIIYPSGDQVDEKNTDEYANIKLFFHAYLIFASLIVKWYSTTNSMSANSKLCARI